MTRPAVNSVEACPVSLNEALGVRRKEGSIRAKQLFRRLRFLVCFFALYCVQISLMFFLTVYKIPTYLKTLQSKRSWPYSEALPRVLFAPSCPQFRRERCTAVPHLKVDSVLSGMEWRTGVMVQCLACGRPGLGLQYLLYSEPTRSDP